MLAELDLGSEPARARPVDRAIDDDAVQPGCEGPPAIEPVEVADGGQEGLLGDVLGSGGVAGDEPRRTVRARPVLAKQPLEVGDRPLLGTPDPGALRHPSTLRRTFRTRSIRAGDLTGSARRRPCMKRLILIFVLAAAVLPASAPAAGCSPLSCASSGTALGHGLLAVRPTGANGPVNVVDLRTGMLKWKLPSGVLQGHMLVTHSNPGEVEWIDALSGRQTRTATYTSDVEVGLVGASQDAARAVLQGWDKAAKQT